MPERLLFDENPAARLVGALSDAYPDSAHVSELGLSGAADWTIWEGAQHHGHVIVTKDEDFDRLSVLHGPPPKIIWIRAGNSSTKDIIGVLRARQAEIATFVADPEAAFLALA
ncbi:MAG TPA: DUF5615 family PIN-like protein [Stellaceae bacterium]|nr:DUF5615 family PIN-like protein [Stellaceae bacterium]